MYGKMVKGIGQIAVDIVLEENYGGESDRNIMQKIAQILPQCMMPTSIQIVKELKRNGVGKLVRPAKEISSISQ